MTHTMTLRNTLNDIRKQLRSILGKTIGDAELRAIFSDTICELKAQEALLRSKMDFVAEVQAIANHNYEVGGDCIVECMNEDDILERFDTIEDVKQFMEVKAEQRSEAEACIW
jgi:hypothetical protein